MKIVAQPIEMVSYTDNKGDVRPVRFRLQIANEDTQVIKIDKIIVKDKEKLAGNPMLVFRCQSVIDHVEKQFEIKYEIHTCKWMLYKI
jgi:hypothetical protein